MRQAGGVARLRLPACARLLCLVIGIWISPARAAAQSEWRGVVLVGGDFQNDSGGRQPVFVGEVGVRRQKLQSGVLFQATVGTTQRRGEADRGVTAVRLTGARGTIGYRAVYPSWAPYISYELGVQRVSATLKPGTVVGGLQRSATAISTGFAAGVTHRLGRREVGVELRSLRLTGATYTRDRGFVVGVILVL
jgi:hypothetical protein